MKPLILISNDDGYQAKGLNDLINMVRHLGDLLVVAPEDARSGASMSITSSTPVRLRLIRQEEGLKVYACSGTPCDCVKIAFEALLTRRPELILAGINHGDNAAVNTHYSGTMAVALEGAMKGVPSIALSSCKLAADSDFSALSPYVEAITSKVLTSGLNPFTCLNVNFPALDSFKGIKICRMGRGEWVNEWEERTDPRQRTYYWLTGSYSSFDADDPRTDTWALRNGYVSVTPTSLDLTDYSALDMLEFSVD